MTTFVFPVEARGGDPGIGQPVKRDVVEDLVAGELAGRAPGPSPCWWVCPRSRIRASTGLRLIGRRQINRLDEGLGRYLGIGRRDKSVLGNLRANTIVQSNRRKRSAEMRPIDVIGSSHLALRELPIEIRMVALLP
jgi:hypothetical protein